MTNKRSAKVLRTIIKSVRNQEFDYEKREKPITNWTKYDHAQVMELADFLDNTRELVNEATIRIEEKSPPKEKKPGRPPVDPGSIAKILLLQAYLNLPNRVAEGMLHLFGEKLGIPKHFSYKTIERGYDREPVNQILDEVMKISNKCVEGEEDTFSTDGTGHSASIKENYAAKREKQNSKKAKSNKSDNQIKKDENVKQKSSKGNKKRLDKIRSDSFPKSSSPSRSFTYSVMSIGVKHKMISGVSICPNHSIGETTMFPDVFNQTLSSHPNMKNMLGDGAFSARWLTDLVANNGITPFFMPKSNVTFRSKGFDGWKPMLYNFYDDTQDWLKTYHMRSISETVMSMIKCRFGHVLRKRLDRRKHTETYLKHVAHNVRRCGYIEILHGIKAKKLVTCR